MYLLLFIDLTHLTRLTYVYFFWSSRHSISLEVSQIVWVQVPDRFFGQKWAMDYGYQIITALSTNLIGYGLAGVTRRFLVYPVISIWPSNLATIALNRAFHEHDHSTVEGGWKISRMRYFVYCFVGMFVYFWFPNYIIQAMSYFNWSVLLAFPLRMIF